MLSREIIHTTRNIIIQHLVFGGSPSKNNNLKSIKRGYCSGGSSSAKTNASGNRLQKQIEQSASILKKSIFTPPTADEKRVSGKASTFEWEIFGLESQVVQMDLDPGSSITAETGALLEMSSTMEMDTTPRGGFLSSIKRMFTGQGLFLTKFVNTSQTERGRISFSSRYISKILAIRLDEFGGEIICQKNAFLCGENDIEIDPKFTNTFKTGFFGGQGFILQRLSGTGTVFIHAGGSIIYRILNENEKIRVTTGSIVAFQPTIDYNVEFVKGVKNILFSGEGLTMATMTGPGIIILQSLPFDKLVSAISSQISTYSPAAMNTSSSSQSSQSQSSDKS
eukprot:gene3061-3829_t